MITKPKVIGISRTRTGDIFGIVLLWQFIFNIFWMQMEDEEERYFCLLIWMRWPHIYKEIWLRFPIIRWAYGTKTE
jgi:hypothetical protein